MVYGKKIRPLVTICMVYCKKNMVYCKKIWYIVKIWFTCDIALWFTCDIALMLKLLGTSELRNRDPTFYEIGTQ